MGEVVRGVQVLGGGMECHGAGGFSDGGDYGVGVEVRPLRDVCCFATD